jgi:hypothetical protein
MSVVSEGIWFPMANNHHSHRLQNDQSANFQAAIDAPHYKPLPIDPDHSTTNDQPAMISNRPMIHLARQLATTTVEPFNRSPIGPPTVATWWMDTPNWSLTGFEPAGCHLVTFPFLSHHIACTVQDRFFGSAALAAP